MTDTVNPYDLILEQTDTEAVEAVMIGSETVEMLEILGEKPVVEVPATKLDVPLTLEEARPYLDYETAAFSLNTISPMYAWTASWVITIVDEPIRAIRVPRHPTVGELPRWR
ncbi:hypothetical protein [Mesorhizobium sp. A623]